MDYKFLNKVIDRIMSETKIDYAEKRVYTPFFSSLLNSPIIFTYLSPSTSPFPFSFAFAKHCKEVYGLNEQEIEYAWRVYSDDIRYKINEEKYT